MRDLNNRNSSVIVTETSRREAPAKTSRYSKPNNRPRCAYPDQGSGPLGLSSSTGPAEGAKKHREIEVDVEKETA